MHARFHYQTLNEIQEDCTTLGTCIKFSQNTEVLKKPVRVGTTEAPNAFAVLPMEGCDSETDGGISAAVRRRYLRFASGGSGLLWWEACSVVPEGRANPKQMMLTTENKDSISRLVEEILQCAEQENGIRPLNILQLTHSGRYARPDSHTPQPMIVQHDPWLDAALHLSGETPLVSDAYLEKLIQHYVRSAKLAKECGFDGVDIKACHRYLLNELLTARNRDGKYGGTFENRIRLLLNIIRAVRCEVGSDMIIASRFNAFDVHPYPFGFGSDPGGTDKWDRTEPVALTEAMIAAGVNLLSASAGNPYFTAPNVTRPFDYPVEGAGLPSEHPLESVSRLFSITEEIQKAAKDIPVVGTGYTWLRQFIPYAAAANIEKGACKMVGLGRSSIAYPSAIADFYRDGFFHKEKCCITCSKCTQIMRDHGETGCVIRDSAEFLPKYRKYRTEAIDRSKDDIK